MVQARRLTITYMSQEKIYNGITETFGNCGLYNIEGLMFTDSCESVSYSNNPSGDVVNVGTYTITPTGITLSSGSLDNYSLKFITGTYKILNKNVVVSNNGYNETYDSKSFYFDNKDQYTYNGNQFSITDGYYFDNASSPTKLYREDGSTDTLISNVTSGTTTYNISSNTVKIGDITYTLIKTNNMIVSVKTVVSGVTYSHEVFGGNTFYVNGVKYVMTSSNVITEYTYTFVIAGITYKVSYTDDVATRILRNDGVVLANISGNGFTAYIPYILQYDNATGNITNVLNSAGTSVSAVSNDTFTIHGKTYTINYDSVELVNVLTDDGSSISINGSNQFVANSTTYTIDGSVIKQGTKQVATIDANKQFYLDKMYTLNYKLSKAIKITIGNSDVAILGDFISGQVLSCVNYSVDGSNKKLAEPKNLAYVFQRLAGGSGDLTIYQEILKNK